MDKRGTEFPEKYVGLILLLVLLIVLIVIISKIFSI
jgi:hypothetical protein